MNISIPSPILNANTDWPKPVKMKFIEPGLVHYSGGDLNGTCLVRMEFLDKIALSVVGKPVIDKSHKDAKPENFKEVASGVVTRVWKEADGWYWCEAIIWDEDCKKHCEIWSISCAYTPTVYDNAGGTHNGIPYKFEFIDGEYTHIAVVEDPKYEEAEIFNSKNGDKIMKFFKSPEAVENSNSKYVLCDGKKVPLKDIVNAYNAEKEERLNAVDDDSVLEIDGEKVPVKNMIEAYRKSKKSKENHEEDEKEAENGLSEPDEKEKSRDLVDKGRDEAESGSGQAKANSPDAAVSARPKKTFNDEEGKAQKKESEEHDKEEKEEGKVFNSRHEFAELMEHRGKAQPSITTSSDRIKLGRDRYGKSASR